MMGGFAQKTDRMVHALSPDPVPPIKLSWASAIESCAQPPVTEATLADPICTSLLFRGRELECVAGRIAQEGLRNKYAARDGLLNWEICVKDVSRVLTEGYYLGKREIERRLQLCEGLLEAAATQPAQGLMSRLLGQTPPAVPARPAPADVGIGGRDVPTGLLKCEVLLRPKPLPVEITPVAAEPVTEVPPATPTAAPTQKAPKKKRSQKVQAKPTGKDKPAMRKPAGSAGGDGPGARPGDESENVRAAGKRT